MASDNTAQHVEALLEKVEDWFKRLTEAEDDEAITPEAADRFYNEILPLRAELETLSVFGDHEHHDHDESEAHAELHQLEDDLTDALAEIELAVASFGLLDARPARALHDHISAPAANATMAQGLALLEKLEQYVSEDLSPRYFFLAMTQVLPEDLPDPEDPETSEEEADQAMAAYAMATDFALCDFRWAESDSVIDRFLAANPGLDETDKAALSLVQNSAFALYKVEQVDRKSGALELSRTHDGAKVGVGVEPESVEALRNGDGVLGRVLVFSDSALMPAWLAIDKSAMGELGGVIGEILEAEDGAAEDPNSRMKSYGFHAVRTVLDPSDEYEVE